MGEDLTPEFTSIDHALKLLVAEVKAKQRAESAELIRGELVCPCQSFERMEAIPYDKGRMTDAHRARRKEIDHHDICFFGEWAAVIVEKGPRE